MITVHHLASSQSERILWLCEELGLPYDLRRYERDPETRLAPPEYKALSPFGTAPVITDGDITIGESGAIVEYLCRVHGGGRLLPGPDHPDYVAFLFWFHFANGSFIPALTMDVVTGGRSEPGGSRKERAMGLIEAWLGEAPWFAGDIFSAADIMMSLPRFALRWDVSGWPNIAAYLERAMARPACARAMAIAEPDAAKA